jgi:hypothetical protein
MKTQSTPLLACLAAVCLSNSSAHSAILLNEAHVDPPGQVNSADGDADYEYIELISTTGGAESTDGLWILQVDVRGGRIGVVKEAWDLTGLATGTNGLLLLGDGYDSSNGGPWASQKAPATTVGDPSGMGGDNLDDNDAFCLFLVRNFTGTPESSTSAGTDIDQNDDGIPSVGAGTLPWLGASSVGHAGVLDSVGFSDRAEVPMKPPLAAANLTKTGYDPGNVSRKPGITAANSAAAWYGGAVDGASLLSVSFSASRHFGLLNSGGVAAPGEATPGTPNYSVSPSAATFGINEVSLNPSGSPDGNAEYIELTSGARAFASLSGLTLLVIDSNNEPPERFGPGFFGEVVEAWPLDGLATGSNGLILLGDGYAPGQTPWGSFVPRETAVADPPGMGTSDIGENNGFTVMLVRGFNGNGASGSTAGSDVDTNDDGVIESPRWTEVVDDLGFDQVDPLNPSASGLGKTYATARITTTPAYDPDCFARIAGDMAAHSAASWYGGDFGGNSRLATGLRTDPVRPNFGPFKGEATPGRPNLSAAPSGSGIFINEINFNPAQSPDPNANNEEYVELIGETKGVAGMNGLTLLILDAVAPGLGQINEAISLSGLSTGANGLTLIGDAYDNGTPYGVEVSALSNREDPSGYDAGDIGRDKDGFAMLIVRDFTGVRGQDLDTDDDGTLNTKPWSAVLDGVGTGAIQDAELVSLTVPAGVQVIARHHDDLRRTAAAWHGTSLAGGGSMVAGGAVRFGLDYVTAASPGRWNHTAAPAGGTLLLNEVVINPPGGPDGNREFIELISTGGGALSTNGYTLLLFDSSVGNNLTGNVGRVLEAWSLDGLATGPNGLLLVGEGYNTAAIPWTGAAAPDAATRLADPEGLDADDIGLDSDNGAFSLLLVKHFVGAAGEDLDILGGSADAGDGQLEFIPWSEIADSLAMRYWNAAPEFPPARFEGIIYGPVNLSQTGYTPDMAARVRGRLTPLSAGAWFGGDILEGTILDVGGFPAGFAGSVSPGRLNPADTTYYSADPDGDGVLTFVEEALVMNPQKPDNGGLPVPVMVDGGSGRVVPGLTWRQLSGGSGTPGLGNTAGEYRYQVEFSSNLGSWRAATADEISVASQSHDTAAGATTVTVRLNDAEAGGFLRLRITRQ